MRFSLLGSAVSKGLFFAFLGFSLFSCGDALVKYMSSKYSVILILFWGQLSGFLILSTLAFLRQDSFFSMIASPYWRRHILRGILMAGQVASIFYAFSQITLAQAYSLVFAAPVFSTLLARIFLKESVPFKKWLALIAGFAGILIILRPWITYIDPGMLAALASAFFFAASYILGRSIGKTDDAFTFGFYPLVLTFTTSGLYLLIKGASFQLSTSLDMALISLVGGFSIFALLLLSWAFNNAPVPSVSSFHYTQILWGVLFGWLFFGETPDIWTYPGCAIIIASGLYMIWHDKKAARSFPLA